MLTIALAGRRHETADWARSVLDALSLPADALVQYRHWISPDEASVDFEAQRLTEQKPDLLIAKSFGTNVAATAYCDNELRPRTAILIGVPFAPMTDHELGRMHRFATGQPTLFIQQGEDPGGAARALPQALKVEASTVASVPGNDHLYADVPLLAEIIRAWPEFAERVASGT
jgi:hypothetical protein